MNKKLENKYVFRRKIFLHEKHSDQNFLRKTNFTSLFKLTVHPFNKSSIDFSDSNNPTGENHESNRAKDERKLQ